MVSSITFLPLLHLVWSAMGPNRAGLADPIAMVMESYTYVFTQILLVARLVAFLYTTIPLHDRSEWYAGAPCRIRILTRRPVVRSVMFFLSSNVRVAKIKSYLTCV